jgi:hypothetical protein
VLVVLGDQLTLCALREVDREALTSDRRLIGLLDVEFKEFLERFPEPGRLSFHYETWCRFQKEEWPSVWLANELGLGGVVELPPESCSIWRMVYGDQLAALCGCKQDSLWYWREGKLTLLRRARMNGVS